MRRWIEVLITNKGAHDDFNAYIKDIEQTLNADILKAVKTDKIPEAKAFAAELTAYQKINQSIKASARELQSQLTYQEQIK